MTKPPLSVLCWNIGNPSPDRAGRQADWLVRRGDDVIVLTETKHSRGCEFIQNYLGLYGWNCLSSQPSDDYGVMIASKAQLIPGVLYGSTPFLPSRATSARVQLPFGLVEIAAVYVPSRDASPLKTERKRCYLEKTIAALRSRFQGQMRILCGDLNILEPAHFPRYSFFQEWEYRFYNDLMDFGLIDAFRHIAPDAREYSWVGRTGEGYRYDHCFVSSELLPRLYTCHYDHEPRVNKLSDHSALVTNLLID